MKNISTQTTIYVGLNDSETYLSILKNVCKSYGAAFSVHLINGGYFHEDGRYVDEMTLSLMLMNTPETTVMEIAKDLCAFFHQESVMVTSAPCTTIFVKESLE